MHNKAKAHDNSDYDADDKINVFKNKIIILFVTSDLHVNTCVCVGVKHAWNTLNHNKQQLIILQTYFMHDIM